MITLTVFENVGATESAPPIEPAPLTIIRGRNGVGKSNYEGIEFDAVNTGKRMELCIRMATLRSTKCPIIIVDDAVNIDDANWEAFVAAARQSNLQIVAARLDSGDLRIEAYDSLEVAA